MHSPPSWTRRLLATLGAAILITALLPASAGAKVTTPIPTPAMPLPPPVADLPPAGNTQPGAELISDLITPEATCGGWAIQTSYGGRWPTDQAWWEFSCEHKIGPCVGPGACNADNHSNDHETVIDHFAYDGSAAVFYGETLDFFWYFDFDGAYGCNLWWDQAAAQWFVDPDPLCPYADGLPPLPNQAPTAVALADCTGLGCWFHGTMSFDPDGPIVSYAWSFGDGSSSSMSSESHRYASAGSYQVTLTVTDEAGAAATDAIQVVVANRPPVARASVACTGLDCTFNSGSSIDVDGQIVSVAWSFGDGSTSSTTSGVHHYASPGTYAVALAVTDDLGSSSSDTVNAVAQNLSPTAVIAMACAGLDCQFDGAGSRDPDGSVVGYRWSFGDGSGGTSPGGVHHYASVGSYTVTLDVTDDRGGAGTASSSMALIGLQATPTKVRGVPAVNLRWTGATGASFVVDRNGTVVASGQQTSVTDLLPRGLRGTVSYRVCQSGVSICSAVVTVVI